MCIDQRGAVALKSPVVPVWLGGARGRGMAWTHSTLPMSFCAVGLTRAKGGGEPINPMPRKGFNPPSTPIGFAIGSALL
jgi:hypothetical protein